MHVAALKTALSAAPFAARQPGKIFGFSAIDSIRYFLIVRRTVMTSLTPEQIAKTFGLTPAIAQNAVGLMSGTLAPIDFPPVVSFSAGCVEPPSNDELIAYGLQLLLNGYSVEEIYGEDEPEETEYPQGEPGFDDESEENELCAVYINVGNLDHLTLIFDFDTQEWLLNSVNAYLEE